MPWTGSEFAERHNHSLHGARADHAAHIANAILRRGVPEGEAIAIANKRAATGGGLVPHYDDGGAVDPSSIGGIAPSASTANPLMQGMIQRYAAYPTEKLQELAGVMGGSQQGQLISSLLRQRMMHPQSAPQAASQPQQMPQAPAVAPIPQPGQAQQPMARGGAARRDIGGGMGMPSGILNEPERIAARQDSGFIHGATPGRADQIETTAPGGSHVIPADVIAGLGQGNNLAGAKIFSEILRSGPYGTDQTRGTTGRGPPRAPPVNYGQFAQGGDIPLFEKRDRNSEDPAERAEGGEAGKTAVDLSDGEFVVSPEDVIRWGGGDKKRGHRILDKFILAQRERNIKDQKKLKPPVKV